MTHRLVRVLLVLLVGLHVVSARAQSPLLITEFMAANGKTLADEDKDYSDWIEIHNASSETVSLEGWSLSDSTNLVDRWFFPSTNLPPDGFLVVFASGKNRAVAGKQLHTSFSLNAEGDYLALFMPDDEGVANEFAPVFPLQKPDISYGTYEARNYFFPTPTPGKANAAGYESFVADTKFSVNRGFYDSPFVLTIGTATPDATIRYTTNGTIPSLTNGLAYQGPITIAGTTVLRAAAFKAGLQPSNVDTQTYLFLDDVIHQSPTGAPAPGWPASWGSNTRDYGMDPDVVNNPLYKDTIKDDLKTIPSFSVVMDLADLFNSTRGIYANAGSQGRSWERKCSLELVYPTGTKGFQIDAGIRIRGGYSRSTGNPKHAFRFFFREQYGAPKLRYPLFADGGADAFDCFDLRTFQNYSWSFEGDSRGIFMRDQSSRDTQLAMGHNAERGDYYHLYINGQYWGLYNTCERAEASYGETYFGGDKSDYDVIKVEAGAYNVVATDGNMLAWNSLYQQCKGSMTNDATYERIQGNNPDGTPNPAYPNLIDVDNLIDYMLVILYGGNYDSPISWFLSNTSPNNWYGMRDRNGTAGFRFFAHDAEHTMVNLDSSSAANVSRIGPYSAGDSSVSKSSPQWVWQRLWANAEFRLRTADRIHKHFFNGGALTPEGSAARFLKRKNEIDRAVVGESARWGDSKRPSSPLTRQDWLATVNDLLQNYFPLRTAAVLAQLKGKNLYPSVVAPVFNQFGGKFDAGFALSMTAPSGAIYYTLDGSDPRLRGGALAPGAHRYTSPVPLTESVRVKSRTLQGQNWSALNEASFTLIQTFTNLVVTEIMYNPLPEGSTDGDDFEFLELKNTSLVTLDLSGVHFTNGITYVFPQGTQLGVGKFIVLARNLTNFAARYPGVQVDGVFGGALANGGERIELVHAVGTPISSVNYSDQPPWAVAADGSGFSLVPVNPNFNPDPNDPANWRASSRLGGSPGADDPAPETGSVLINEILTHTAPPEVDAIELYNPGTDLVDISGWFLTDDRTQPKKFRIPSGTTISGGGFRVFDETQFTPSPGVEPGFMLSSQGEEVFLYSADSAGTLTGFSDGFAFDAAATGVSFGRYTNSVGEIQYPAQRESTLGLANSGPRVGPVVINEINYQPATGEAEFIELKNLTDQGVKLYDPLIPTNTWRIVGVGFDFPTNAEVAAHGLLVVAGGDPAAFRTRHGVPAKVPIYGPYSGILQNSGEMLQLQRPDAPDIETNGVVVVPHITVDEVRYNDKAPWPTNAAGLGSSLERVRSDAYGNDPVNWRASFGETSPGLENDGNRRPVANAGLDRTFESTSFPVSATLSATASDDGLPKPSVLSATWSQISGPSRALCASPTSLNTTVALPEVGTYTLRVTVEDGELQAIDDVIVTVTRPPAQRVLIKQGSEWKYWDKGTSLGTAWRASDYIDTAWAAGKAQLGYSVGSPEGDEVTTVGYGGDANNKYITTYFRTSFTLADVASVTALTAKLLRDDGALVYLNGKELFRDNMPEGDVNFGTTAPSAVGGTDESTFFEHPCDISPLKDGLNVLAVEIHQSSASSTDLSFDLQLEAMAFPSNHPPTADAGPDQTITLPSTAVLAGNFTDDGVPNATRGFSALWSKVSGPGNVVFADTSLWRTTAAFSDPGAYVLRLTIDDGALAATDDVAVTVEKALPPPRIESVELVAGPPSVVRLSFAAEAGRTYVIEFRESLSEGVWKELTNLPARGEDGPAVITDPLGEQARYYRLQAR